MDYGSYKTTCDTTLQQIRKSENKRQELNHKLQKMYQEKSECEKSMMKAFESQQKQFADEKRRREERNENILRTLERIDYQASSLAAKTERLRALKKQYEKYLMSLWHQRRHQVYSTAQSFTPASQLPATFAPKFDELSLHQSSNYALPSHSMYVRSPCYNALLPATPHYAPPDNLRFIHNQSCLPSAVFENSIRRSNYRTTGADIEPQFSYPATATTPQVSRYDDYPQIPPYQQSSEMKSFHRNDNTINNVDTSQPTTINSIYRYRVPGLEEQPSPGKAFVPSYLQSNKPLENHNYNSGNSRVSETFFGEPLITLPVAVADSLVTQSSRVAATSEKLLKNHPVDTLSSYTPKSVYLSDGDEESDGEKPSASKRNMRRSDSISDDTYRIRVPFTDTHNKADQQDFIDNLHSRVDKATLEATCNEKLRSDALPNENMHQVWEKIVEPVQTSFVIPKIIVDTQIDLVEATVPTIDDSVIETHASAREETFGESSGTPSNDEMRKYSGEDRQIVALSTGDATINNNSPLAEAAASSIYHYDKQPIPDEQQSTRVERALDGYSGAQDDAAALAMTYESDSMPNNSSEGISDDVGGRREAESINNIVDDDNQGTPSVALNDKITEIYRKIEKIEGNYYGEKEKIMEHSERRPSVAVAEAKNEDEVLSAQPSEPIHYPQEFLPEENTIYEGGEWTNSQYQNEIAPVAAYIEPDSQGQPDYASYGGYPEGETQQTYEGTPGEVYPQQYQYDGQQLPQSNEAFDAGVVQTGYDNTDYPYEQAYTVDPYQKQQSEFMYTDEAALHQQQEANNYDPSFNTQSDPNYQQNNYHEAPENPSNYTNDTAGVYYDYDQQPATDPQTMYSDTNYSHHQSGTVDGDASQYFYENDENKAVTYPEYSTENNYAFAETPGDNGIPYNPDGYQTGDGTHDDVANMHESQTTNETTLDLHANYDSQHFEQPSNENFERDESYLTTTTTDESSESSKPLETEANVNVNMSGGADDGANAPSQLSKRDDVKLVKQLLDSESDDTTSRSNLLKTSIKEEADESDFDFSAS